MCVCARAREHGVRLFLRSSSRSEPDAPSPTSLTTVKGATITADTWCSSQSERSAEVSSVCVCKNSHHFLKQQHILWL